MIFDYEYCNISKEFMGKFQVNLQWYVYILGYRRKPFPEEHLYPVLLNLKNKSKFFRWTRYLPDPITKIKEWSQSEKKGTSRPIFPKVVKYTQNNFLKTNNNKILFFGHNCFAKRCSFFPSQLSCSSFAKIKWLNITKSPIVKIE